MLLGGGAAATLVGAGLVRYWMREKAGVFIAKNQTYTGDLARTIRDGLVACGLVPESLRGKRVLLKPNMVAAIRSGRGKDTRKPASSFTRPRRNF